MTSLVSWGHRRRPEVDQDAFNVGAALTEALSVICKGVSDILSRNELSTLFSLCDWSNYVVPCSACYAGMFKSQHIRCYTS